MIAKYTPPAGPFMPPLPSDVFTAVGNSMEQRRGGVLVATYNFGQMPRTVLAGVTFINGSSEFAFYREERMPGIISTLVDVVRSGEIIRFRFAGGTEREFADLPTALGAVEYLDVDETTTQDVLILKTLRNSPDGANLENMVGGSCSSDFNADDPLNVVEPV